MADINKVVLIGRLTRDAEQTYTQSGYTVIKFSIAVNRRRKQGDNWVDEANFFDVTSFGRQGEAIVSYMNKGRQIAVEGQLRQDRWEAQDGTKRSKVYVDANYIQLIGNRKDNYSENSKSDDDWTSRLSPSEPAADMPSANFEDDIPF